MASRPRKSSQIWGYFSDIGENKAKCNFCNKTMSYKGGSIFNLTRHVRTQHPTVCLSVKRLLPASSDNPDDLDVDIPISGSTVYSSTNTVPEQSSSSAAAATAVPPPPPQPRRAPNISEYFHRPLTNKKNQELDFLLVETIAKNYLPFRIVEDVSFRKFMHKANLAYKLPTRKTVSRVLLPQMCDMIKVKVRDLLQSADTVTITTDGWTSITNESYLSVTVHFINEHMEMKSSLIECFKYNEQHTAVNLAEELKRVTEDWGIRDKVACVVSDSAPNIKAAIRLTGWKHIPCFAHTLNLIVQYGLENIRELLTKIKRVVEFFKRSTQASIKLKAMQEQLGEPALSLKLDVATRWNSTYEMLRRMFDVKNSVISVTAIHYPELPSITNDDTAVMNQICDLLKAFKDCTEEMSSEQHVTVSKVILLHKALKKWCSKFITPTVRDNVREMAERLIEALNKRFQGIEENNVCAQATLLDPRFKSYGFSDPRNAERAKQSLITYCEKSLHSSAGSASAPTAIIEKGSAIWDESVNLLVSNPNPRAAAIVEVDKFLQEPLLPRKGNPLSWWSERKQVYPSLYELAKARLSIVATSVPCERIFSKAGQIVTENRNRLTGKRVEQLLFLNSNI